MSEATQVLTVFRNRLRPEHVDEYSTTGDRMNELARSMPGYVDHKTFTAADGERVTIVTFEDAESQRAWRDLAEHRAAQQAGRDRFYAEYAIQGADVRYSHHWRHEG